MVIRNQHLQSHLQLHGLNELAITIPTHFLYQHALDQLSHILILLEHQLPERVHLQDSDWLQLLLHHEALILSRYANRGYHVDEDVRYDASEVSNILPNIH